MDKQLVTGDNIDQKFSKINVILNRLQRRAKQYGTVVIPQTPLLFCVNAIGVDGLIGRILIPVGGTIKSAYLYVESVQSKTKPKLKVKIQGSNSSQTEKLPYKAGLNVLTKDIPVDAGIVIELSTTDPDKVSGLAVGLVFQTLYTAAEKTTILQDTIIAGLEAQDAGETEE